MSYWPHSNPEPAAARSSAATATRDHSNPVADPHESAAAELAELRRLIPLVRALMPPDRGRLDVLRPKPTPAAEERLAELIAQERDDAIENLWDGIVAQGRSPAPLSVAALDVAVIISGTLLDAERVIWSWVPAAPVRVAGSDAARLLRISRHLPEIHDVATVRSIARLVGAAVRAATTLVEGESRRRLDSSCPYCHRESLVVYQRDPGKKKAAEHREAPAEFIRCDKPSTEPCICPVAACPCKAEGGETYRHLWSRDRGGWDNLARLITQHDATCVVCRARDDVKEAARAIAHGARLGLTAAETREVITAWPPGHPAKEVRLAMTRRARGGDWTPTGGTHP